MPLTRNAYKVVIHVYAILKHTTNIRQHLEKKTFLTVYCVNEKAQRMLFCNFKETYSF